MAKAADVIEQAVTRLQEEVPTLKRLKLVFGVELRGGRDIQLYRVEVPGPKITKDLNRDERVLVQMERATLNHLAEKGTVKSYRRAVETGQIKFEGDSNVQKLIVQVIDRHQSRQSMKKAH